MSKQRNIGIRGEGKQLLAIGNFIVISAIILSCLNFTNTQRAAESVKEENSFYTTVVSMQKVLRGYILSQQRYCNNWAAYINRNDMTFDEALDYITEANSVDEVMGQIIDYDTMKGSSAVPDYRGGNAVDYSEHISYFDYLMTEIKAGELDEDMANLTRTYINPINNQPTVSFCQNISLRQEDGSHKDYMLICAVLLSRLEDQWVFPTGYDEGELSLITSDGAYVMRSKSFGGENYWEFMQSCNNLDAETLRDTKEQLMSQQVFTAELLNGEGNMGYYVMLQAKVNSDFYYIGYVPKDSIVTGYVDFTMVIIVLAGVFVLTIMDGGFILYTNKKLQESAEETKRANDAKTRFLSSMSHDIRTPMNAIVGMTAIAAKRVNDPQQVTECLGKINLASNHLLTLINDILDISKVESGRMTLNPMVFSLPEIVANLINISRPQVEEKGLEFNVHVRGIEHEYLYADELRINQIFINILSNAVKYTNSGSITIDVEERPCEDDKSAVKLIYSVKDTGIGMSKEFMEHMYKTFVRAVDARIDRVQGSGLGLSITKEMVDLMNGTIDCESEPGKGTRFTVTLTLPVAEKLTDGLMLPPMQILVVDDDEVFLETAESTLESMGATVEVTDGGEKAVKMVAEHHKQGRDYPVVIIDWRMPGMDGIETTRAIRKEVGRNVPIIIISSYDWTEVEEDAIAAGADAFITKPLFKSTVYSKVNEILHFDSSAQAVDAPDDFSDLEGLRLLVTEDNELNWEIIRELLSYNGIKTERAENGQICVDMISGAKAGDYDAVLMDIQMPVMNGREATKAIRALHDESKNSIPIIAMTADAFAEDVQECFSVGMDAHVSKPVDMKKLMIALRNVGLGKHHTEGQLT